MKEKLGLSASQVNLAADVLVMLFPGKLDIHVDGLCTAAGALRAAAMVCELASALHEKEGREVLLKTACHKLYLPAAKQDAIGKGGTQELVEKLFGLVYVDLNDQINSRRDAWEPRLVAARGVGIGGIFNETHPPTMESDEQPNCCLECANMHCIKGPEHQKHRPEHSTVDGSWSCSAYKRQSDCVHSPSSSGECFSREAVSVPAGQPEENAQPEHLRVKWPICTLCSQVPAECKHDPLANGTCAGYTPCNLTQAAAAQDALPVSS